MKRIRWSTVQAAVEDFKIRVLLVAKSRGFEKEHKALEVNQFY